MKLTLAEAAIGAGALLEAPASFHEAGALVVGGYSIDSRTVASGELFFAVRGDRHDGHDFVEAALKRGAVAAVVSHTRAATLPDAALAVPLLIADDPLAALQALAAHVRRQWGRRVVAVTGSAGKTTTKDCIAHVLGARFHVLKSLGNLNNHFGLPMQLLRLEAQHDRLDGWRHGAARKSLAGPMIGQLPGGYDQMLGRRFENGVELSAGQWQKVALGRAYMRDAQVLILDEPTASLDARAEYEVFLRFADLTRGRMAVLISHRFSTVRMADRILVLADGELVEQGTHPHLVALGGRYAELFELQAAGYR